jgi:hypothetical protein
MNFTVLRQVRCWMTHIARTLESYRRGHSHRVWKMTGSRCMFTQDGALIQTDASEGATLSMTSEKSQFIASIMSGSMSRSKTIRLIPTFAYSPIS